MTKLSLLLLAFSLTLFPVFVFAEQDDNDLMGMLDEIEDEQEEETIYTEAVFRSTRVINSHSVENMGKGTLDFRISHRFGAITGGFYEMFGLDQAQIRLAFEYAFRDDFTMGIGRNSFMKTYDGFARYSILRQSSGKVEMPLSLVWFSSVALVTDRNYIPVEDDAEYFSRRFNYVHQIIAGRKFNDNFSLQLMPTFIHRNLVPDESYEHDVFAIGAAGRYDIFRRTSLNLEYFYLLPGHTADNYYNSFSIGFDIETGGHVFQLHFTNSLSMIEKGYIAETRNNWLDGDIHFGFNISRVF